MEKVPAKRRSQGLTQRDSWRAVATTLGGLYSEGAGPDRDSVVVPRGPWSIIVDKRIESNQYGSTSYTRTRGYFVAQDDFSLRISRRRWYSRFTGPFAPEDVTVGDSELEAKYVIRSRHAARVRSLLHDKELRRLILAQPSLRLEVRGLSWWHRRKLGSRVRVATVRTTGIVSDHDRLLNFVELISTTLEQLSHIGSASRISFDKGRHHGDIRRKL
jgi:hypothetical protein